MIENFKSFQNINLPEIDANKLTSVKKVIEFLDKHLPDFPDDFRPRTANIKTIRENLISRELNIFLNRRRRQEDIFMFEFQWEDTESTRSSDLAAITVENQNSYELTKAFFLIEAKRLPTPGTGRDKEYVEGNYGGVERYKRGHHGGDLPESALIGYIQDENKCSYWQQEINRWITNLVAATKAELTIQWDNNDLLVVVTNFGTTQRYYSQNVRIIDSNKDSIKLHHYLMELV